MIMSSQPVPSTSPSGALHTGSAAGGRLAEPAGGVGGGLAAGHKLLGEAGVAAHVGGVTAWCRGGVGLRVAAEGPGMRRTEVCCECSINRKALSDMHSESPSI